MSGFAPGPVAGFAPRPKKLNGVLRRAVAAWKAENYQPNIDALVDLTGRGHHARFGSAIGADTNDPLRLPFSGQKYLHLPGTSGNSVTTPNTTGGTAYYRITKVDDSTVDGSEVGATVTIGGTTHSGSIKRVQVFSDVSMSMLVADLNPADSAEPHTSWVSSATGETWTINRSATGRKAVLVDRPLLLLGTDDFLEVANHADLNPGAGSFTAVTVARRYGTPMSDHQPTLSKYDRGFSPGYWSEWRMGAGQNIRASARDGTTNYSAESSNYPSGVVTLHGNVIDRDANQLRSHLNGVQVGTPADITGAAPITNTGVLRIGSYTNNTGFADCEFIGAALFREALTPADLALLAAEFGVTP